MICHGFKGGIGTSSRIVGGSAGDTDGEAPGDTGGEALGDTGGEALGDTGGEAPGDTAGGVGSYTVGVLVQVNHGSRRRLVIDGFPVGRYLDESVVPLPGGDLPEGMGSIITVVATDAPLLPHQCRSLAARTALGIGRAGGVGEHWSGDLLIAFATGHSDLGRGRLGRAGRSGTAGGSGSAGQAGSSGAPDRGSSGSPTRSPEDRARSLADPPDLDTDHREAAGAGPLMVDAGMLVALYEATVDATEEAIVNALFAAETMTGRDGITAHALPIDRVRELISGQSG